MRRLKRLGRSAALIGGVLCVATWAQAEQRAAAPTAAAPSAGPVIDAPPLVARTFTAPVGVIFNTVRSDRVADFEKLIGHLQRALAASTDPTVQQQAKGWRVLKAAEPGPGGAVLYLFMLDPTVPKAEYGLAQILAEAYPDPTQLREIWKLYTSSVTSGGSLLNLSPVSVTELPSDASAAGDTAVQPASPEPTQPRMMPPDRDTAPRR